MKKTVKIGLTDRKLRSLKPRAIPYDVMDNEARSYGVRVLPTGEIIHILYCRFPGSKNPTRRKLGRYGNPGLRMGDPEMSLAQARDLAFEWIAKIRKGIDPSREEEQAREARIEAERLRKANTFEAALQAHLAHKSDLRSIRTREMEMRRELKSWLDRPLSDITEREVRELINRIKASGRKGTARATFLLIKAFFNWTVEESYLNVSPCARIKTNSFVGTTPMIERQLEDHEIRAFWRASDKLGYPFGPYFKLLLLTGLRRNEASDASWSELNERRWVIPAARMKGKPGKTRAHLVPLTDEILALLDSLPPFTSGYFLFSSANGAKPISSFSKAKAAIDKLMKAELAKEGRDFTRWTIHDIRRTCRSRFSSIGILPHIGERLLAHSQPELTQRYDLYGFEKEKLAGLEAWHRKLRDIVRPVLHAVAA